MKLTLRRCETYERNHVYENKDILCSFKTFPNRRHLDDIYENIVSGKYLESSIEVWSN